MNTRCFALVNDLDAALTDWRAARTRFQELDHELTTLPPDSAAWRAAQRKKELQFGEVVHRVQAVVRVIRRHPDALAD